jgi:ferritin-like metal-binding protein YciE
MLLPASLCHFQLDHGAAYAHDSVPSARNTCEQGRSLIAAARHVICYVVLRRAVAWRTRRFKPVRVCRSFKRLGQKFSAGASTPRVAGMTGRYTLMVETCSLHGAFVEQLRDAYDAKQQWLEALPALARAASAVELEAAFEGQLEQTRTHVERLEQVFNTLGVGAGGRRCAGMAGILEDAMAGLSSDFDETVRDACLIVSAQRAVHYTLASYGSLTAWARTLRQVEAAGLLQWTLAEQKTTDATLSTLAERGINAMAAGGARRPVLVGEPPVPLVIDPVLHDVGAPLRA